MVDRVLREHQFWPLLERAAKRNGVVIERRKYGVVIVHSDKLSEIAPKFHEPTWAAWWAFRVLHPDREADFDDEMRALFEEYKKGRRRWANYNHEKRRILAKYLRMRHTP